MSIFNEFPYTNFHEMNLDWILNLIKDLEKSGDGIEEKLEELRKLIEASGGSVNAYYSNEQAWYVIRIKDAYVLSRYFIQTGEITTYQKITTEGDYRINLGFWMPDQAKILPVPLEYASVGGSVESYNGIMTNAKIENKSTFRRKTLLFDAAAGPQGSTRTVGTNSIVTGKHATPPAAPVNAVKPKRQEAVDIANSYYQARKVNGRLFKYGANAITYAASNVINDANGYGMMECDTLVALVMMGIPYNLSPYANDTPGYTYDFTDLVENPNNLTWPLSWKFNSTLNRKVTYTGGENWYFWDNNMVFKDIEKVASGDVAIFRRNDGKYFDGITHIGIVNLVDGKPWLYHVTGLAGVESPMMYEPLENVLKRGNYTLEENVYFARPDYA